MRNYRTVRGVDWVLLPSFLFAAAGDIIYFASTLFQRSARNEQDCCLCGCGSNRYDTNTAERFHDILGGSRVRGQG